MYMLKIFVFAPDDESTIIQIIKAAAQAGAGEVGNYSECAFVTRGTGQWKSEPGSKPKVGVVGELSQEPQVKIEMICPEEKIDSVISSVKKIHPFEEPEINVVKLLDL